MAGHVQKSDGIANQSLVDVKSLAKDLNLQVKERKKAGTSSDS